MQSVEIQAAGPNQCETLANLFQLYTHDFSEYWRGLARGDLSEDGRFPDYEPLDSYWREPGREALLIRADGRLAGFALVNRLAHSGQPTDFNMAEFFVARKYRRTGVGQAAATAIIRARSGQWEVAVARRNVGALAFWRRVAVSVASGRVAERDHSDADWNGPILRFHAG